MTDAIKASDELTETERDALASAAAWYAKYHARIIADRADDPSASAMAERERYLNLLSGLEKLGFRMRNPLGTVTSADEAQTEQRRAA